MSSYSIIGIQYRGDPPPPELEMPPTVARVRMFVDGISEPVDEDFDLPTLPSYIPKTEEVYGDLLNDTIQARIVELSG